MDGLFQTRQEAGGRGFFMPGIKPDEPHKRDKGHLLTVIDFE